MRKYLGLVVAGLLLAGTADAATWGIWGPYLTFQVAPHPGVAMFPPPSLFAPLGPPFYSILHPGGHLGALSISGGIVRPVTGSVPVTSSSIINSVIWTSVANQAGVFTGLATPSGGGPMGLSGTAKIALVFGGSFVTVPLTPSGTPAAGFGVGGTQTIGGSVAITVQHNPWMISQPGISIHTPNSTITVPTLPGGFVHGPTTGGASSAVTTGFVLQLVTATKVYTSLTNVLPEVPLIGIIRLGEIPEPGTLLLLGSGVAVLTLYGRRLHRR